MKKTKTKTDTETETIQYEGLMKRVKNPKRCLIILFIITSIVGITLSFI